MARSNSKHVFISYSSKDKPVAEAVCETLEGKGIKTWIAPRDLKPGHWDGGLRDAIEGSRAMLFVWSRQSDFSGPVKKELMHADEKRIPIVPFRIENFEGGELEFFLKPHHWFFGIDGAGRLDLNVIVEAINDLAAGRRRQRGSSATAAVDSYMIGRGPKAFQDYTAGPQQPLDLTIRGEETARNLRGKLLRGAHKLKKPISIKVHGTLFPCALLSSGWWDKHGESKVRRIKWRDGLQHWLFHGFDEWGPSWDFTWDLENWSESSKRPYFIAQLGDGDEANSIPVLLPASKAAALQQEFKATWGGLDAEVSGVLGHRSHFAQHLDSSTLELFGGLLDYCLWLDEDRKDHVICPTLDATDIYSGYLWKCVAPKVFVEDRTPRLNDVYFIWEHVNFANDDALKYCLEAMEHKEDRVRREYGELILVQKSSSLVSGVPTLSPDMVYGMLLGKGGKAI